MTLPFTLVLRAIHGGLGTARDQELVVPSVFGPDVVGSTTLLPVFRARVCEEPPRTALEWAAEVWVSAWGGEAPDLDASYLELMEEFLRSLVDFPPGAEVGFSAQPVTAG